MDKKQLFNRNDPSVIKAAMDCDVVEDFVNLYKGTSATEKTLTQAYYDIKYNSKISTIRMKSGATKNNEPISAVPPIKKHHGDKPKPVEETIKVFEAGEAEDGSQDRRYEVPVPPKEKASKVEEQQPTKPKKADKVEKTTTTTTKAPKSGSKQERIVELLKQGKSNKDIKTILAEEGIKVYDSEIGGAKKKL